LLSSMGGDLEGYWGGRSPPKFPKMTTYASVPSIFQEVVLSDACENTN